MAFKMKGMSFKSSPVTKKAGPETKKFDVDKIGNVMDTDESAAYENAINDYDTDNPTKKQLAKSLQDIKDERSNKKRSDAERAHEAREDAEGK